VAAYEKTDKIKKGAIAMKIYEDGGGST